MSRNASIKRTTRETDITAFLDLDGTGKGAVDTGIGFFDHMLEGFARHGLFDLELNAKGDLKVDGHHTVEDAGLVLGNAIREAAGDKKESGATAPVSFPWMTHLCYVPWILAEDPIFPLTAILRHRVLEALRQPLCGNFSMRYLTLRE